MRADALPGDDDVLFGTWGIPGTGGAVSVRGGFGRGVANEHAAFGGVDARAPIARHTETQPLDVEWSGGAGMGVGEYVLVTVPMSVSAGRSWSSGNVWFAPYVSLGAALDYRYGDSDLVPDEDRGRAHDRRRRLSRVGHEGTNVPRRHIPLPHPFPVFPSADRR
jgi:hypothetical protein